MREKHHHHRQMPLMPETASNIQAQELEAISDILNSKPIISELALQGICNQHATNSRAGAKGMSAEQVVRAANFRD